MTLDELPAMAQPRVAAGALILDGAGRILLLRPTYKRYWDIPGGYVEPGESPYAACVREIGEELGVIARVGSMLVIDWAPLESEGDKIAFVFDGDPLSDDDLRRIVFEDGEITEFRYVAPAELDDLVPSRLARRLHMAVAAKRNGRMTYAEHGEEVPGGRLFREVSRNGVTRASGE
ncbi:NUDIX hydrolase [Rugosimonospora acidiphila]|uniref:NUDIX hydrolase n=1 Tax=Rugosimonospora acidiphila TaxID=556531 RepID=UPI0031E5BB27